jgi:hypothetical protein
VDGAGPEATLNNVRVKSILIQALTKKFDFQNSSVPAEPPISDGLEEI